MNQEKLFCENCGAAISKSDAKCPFCGHINYIGAENAYMKELYQTEDEMSELVNEQLNDIKDEAKKNGRLIIKILVGISLGLIVFGLILGGRHLFYYVEDQIYLMKERATIEWENENFPKLDALYEAEDYNGLLLFYDENLSRINDKNYRIYKWPHDGFVNAYRKYVELKRYEDGYISPESAAVAFFGAVWFYFREYDNGLLSMTEEDIQKVDNEYRSLAIDILHNHFKLTDEELDLMYEDLLFDDLKIDDRIPVISFEKCKPYAEEIYNNLR